jgi:hypothetical protein
LNHAQISVGHTGYLWVSDLAQALVRSESNAHFFLQGLDAPHACLPQVQSDYLALLNYRQGSNPWSVMPMKGPPDSPEYTVVAAAVGC